MDATNTKACMYCGKNFKPVRRSVTCSERCKDGRKKEVRRADYLKNKDKVLQQCKEWANRNRERMSDRAGEWRRKNPDKVSVIVGRYRAKNIKRIRERDRLRYEENKDQCQSWAKEWKRKNKERCLEYRRQYLAKRPDFAARLREKAKNRHNLKSSEKHAIGFFKMMNAVSEFSKTNQQSK